MQSLMSSGLIRVENSVHHSYPEGSFGRTQRSFSLAAKIATIVRIIGW